MGDKTGIEWCDATWKPIRGCSRVSQGCVNCYAERVASRFNKPGDAYYELANRTSAGPRWTGVLKFIETALDQPLRWKKRKGRAETRRHCRGQHRKGNPFGVVAAAADDWQGSDALLKVDTMKPHNGEKTHPLKPASLEALDWLSMAPNGRPRHHINPGIVDRLLRGGLIEVSNPGPGQRAIVRITQAGRDLLEDRP